jgi:Pregnancy-associated plasma protein-A/Secretion system C-terminal sorting domain
MKIIKTLLLLGLPAMLQAQATDTFPTIVRQFHTQKNHTRLMTVNSDVARKRAFWEMNSRHLTMPATAQEVIIPVVVHVLYTPSGSNIPTDSDIDKQLEIVNKDFRQTAKISKHKADTAEGFANKYAMDMKIKFCLAKKDPSGNNTTGIIRKASTTLRWIANDNMKTDANGGSTAWNTEKYLNIWIVNMPDTISGYAQMPSGPTSTDGIVIDARYFGKKSGSNKATPYKEGKTLTHLLGSYLNLYELWSETQYCGDDGVDDTPIHNAPNLSCPGYRHISTCDGNPIEMTMNFMDNTNDACMYMFTYGQSRRMQACLVEGGIRYKLTLGETQCTPTSNLAGGNVNALKRNDNVSNTPQTTIRIYPNPAQDIINLDIGSDTEGSVEVSVFNAQGQTQTTKQYNVQKGIQQQTILCNDWSTGLYIIRLKINDTIKTERLVINR